MNCPQCGNQIPENMKFCGKCGCHINEVMQQPTQKQKSISLDALLKGAIAFSILLIGFSVFYYFVVFIPRQKTKEFETLQAENKKAIELKQSEIRANKIEREMRLKQIEDNKDACLSNAGQQYSDNWVSECKRLKIKITDGDNCALPMYLADRWDKSRSENEKQCIEQYKQAMQSLIK